ncbi:DNA-processing protein DprA [Nonomuraea harbinensis]|uniref:DNA-processing protein DprA n=1 Tax=Nonomuraea harbinensis TaxID=1286938 RepID=A0ABW1C8Z6_9ACTN|nr:DNA-processing protein DprA [Nonomuraea harbinensis]
MSASSRIGAFLLAATEILPADWRDLSDALVRVGDPEILLTAAPLGGDRDIDLLAYLREGVDRSRIDRWRKQLDCLASLRPQVSLIVVTDQNYPVNLHACYDRPPFIFVDGDLFTADRTALAIVGSRHATTPGLNTATHVAEAAADSGITVVSGLARGIDAAAHHGALRAGGRTLAVIAGGIDQKIYPPEHAGLAAKISSSGAVISQFRPGSPVTKSSFLMRNAVISGLASCSLLIEAGERSGTRTEAEHSLKQGRPVLMWEPCLGQEPWAVEFAANPGVHMVSRVDDILTITKAATHGYMSQNSQRPDATF